MKKKPLYMISIVSEMFEIHPQTLRQYERLELLKPSRSEGNTRLYSDEDIEKLKFILTLTRDMGVNLAGVEIILNMKEQIESLQNQIDMLLSYIKENCEKIKREGALVPSPKKEIIKIKVQKEE
ncbi:MAG: helix-turn-helix transcriptional regulator [Deferribacterales bacterium]|nr:helix-turn-helix transcriptional regulator [Deferribacterales bacterium]